MQFRSLFFILLSVLVLLSCSSGKDKQKGVVQIKDTIPKENFETARIIEVTCKEDNSQSYAMYLPSNYSIGKTFPAIVAFDAHGKGKLPVSLYKELAEQYGYIIIGSNNSKNGIPWDKTKQIAGKLFADIAGRLSLNMDRIYLLGFSGGARVANTITITNGSISGVICCGAAAPVTNSSSPRNNYTFLGIIGNEDFNYIEMRKYDMVDIAGRNLKHGLITFDGKHEWPAREVMDEAFWWLELNEMRKNGNKKNDTLILKRLQPLLKEIEVYQNNKQEFEAYHLCRKTINFYDGLADLSYCHTVFRTLQTNAEVDKALKMEEALWKKEEVLKNKYVSAFKKEGFAWWQKEIALLNQKIKTEKDKEQKLIYKRTLNYLSLAAYMYTSQTFKDNNMKAAEHFGKLYVLVDPTNSEAHYLMASINSKGGKPNEAMSSLYLAVKNGFADVTRLENDSIFSALKNTEEFEKIQERIK